MLYCVFISGSAQRAVGNSRIFQAVRTEHKRSLWPKSLPSVPLVRNYRIKMRSERWLQKARRPRFKQETNFGDDFCLSVDCLGVEKSMGLGATPVTIPFPGGQ